MFWERCFLFWEQRFRNNLFQERCFQTSKAALCFGSTILFQALWPITNHRNALWWLGFAVYIYSTIKMQRCHVTNQNLMRSHRSSSDCLDLDPSFDLDLVMRALPWTPSSGTRSVVCWHRSGRDGQQRGVLLIVVAVWMMVEWRRSCSCLGTAYC